MSRPVKFGARAHTSVPTANDPTETMNIVRDVLAEELAALASLSSAELLEQRYERFRGLGEFAEGAPEELGEVSAD